jgi:tetratricopeptide (TPR) repeat protein
MRIALLLACLLGGLCGLPQQAAAHADDEVIPPVAHAAQGHLKEGRYQEALAAAEAWAAEATGDARAFNLAATSAIFARDRAKAVAYARKSVELAPAAIGMRASLVLALQVAGKRAEREAARSQLYELWRKADATPQRLASFRRDDFDHGGKRVIATEYFEPRGERGPKYEFFIFQGARGAILDKMSFDAGLSYDEARALAAAAISGQR